MTTHDAETASRSHFAAFNAGDADAMLDLVHDDIEHHVNQGAVRRGKSAFADFLAMMNAAYREQARDLVFLAGPDGARMAAEFMIDGTYLRAQDGPRATRGQGIVLPVGSFFALRDGKTARVTTFCNAPDWERQVA